MIVCFICNKKINAQEDSVSNSADYNFKPAHLDCMLKVENKSNSKTMPDDDDATVEE